MQRVHSHAENLGNECADRAALGSFRSVANHNLSTRWARQSFDSVSCFGICRGLGDALESYVTLEQSVCLPPSSRPGVSAWFHAVLRYVSLACIIVLLAVLRSFAWLNLHILHD